MFSSHRDTFMIYFCSGRTSNVHVNSDFVFAIKNVFDFYSSSRLSNTMEKSGIYACSYCELRFSFFWLSAFSLLVGLHLSPIDCLCPKVKGTLPSMKTRILMR